MKWDYILAVSKERNCLRCFYIFAGSILVFEVVSEALKRLCKDIDHQDLSLIYKRLLKEISSYLSDGCPIRLSRLLALLSSIVRHSDWAKISGR